MALSKIINITSLSQLFPAFMLLTLIHVGSTYMSVKVVNEIYLNNQRAFIMFNEYFKSGQILNVDEVNEKEAFYFPNFINNKFCKFIKYGKYSIDQIIDS